MRLRSLVHLWATHWRFNQKWQSNLLEILKHLISGPSWWCPRNSYHPETVYSLVIRSISRSRRLRRHLYHQILVTIVNNSQMPKRIANTLLFTQVWKAYLIIPLIHRSNNRIRVNSRIYLWYVEVLSLNFNHHNRQIIILVPIQLRKLSTSRS